MSDRDSKLKKIDGYLDYILGVFKKGYVTEEFYCDFMLTLALDYYDTDARGDAMMVLKQIGPAIIDRHLENVIDSHPDLLSDLELLVTWLKPKNDDYTFNGPRGQA